MNSRPCATSLLFAVWSLLLVVCTWGGHLYSPDCEVNYRTVQSLAQGNGYAIPPYPEDFGTRRGVDGKEYPQYGPLQPLLAVPLYLTGDRLADFIPPEWLSAQAERLGRTVGFYRPLPEGEGDFQGLYPPDHRERVRRVFVSLFNPLVTWLSALLLFAWGQRLFPNGTRPVLLPSVYLLATIALPYSKPFYTEPLATFCLLMAAWTSHSAGASPQEGLGGEEAAAPPTIRRLVTQFAFVGCLSGLAVLARLDSVVACPGLAVIAVGGLLTSGQEKLTKALAAAGCAGLLAFGTVTTFQLVLNQVHFGSVITSGYSDQPEGIEFNIPILSALWIYLVSPGKGIFWYSPPLFAALLAWPAWVRRDRVLAAGAAGVVLGYLLVVGRWQNLGGWCWGPRHLVQLTPFLLLPIPLLVLRGRDESWRRLGLGVFAVTCLMGGAFQFLGVLVDFMWPLDQTMRGLAPGEDTARALSLPYFGPLLHLWSWKLDPDPDWFLYDLWCSGATAARYLVAAIWGTFACTFAFQMFPLLNLGRLQTKEDSHVNIGIME